MRFRRTREVLLVMAVAWSVTSCGNDSGPVAADAFEPVTPGVLTVVTDLPAPGFWEQQGGEFVGGLEFALAQRLAEELGLALEVRDVEFTDIVSGSLTGYDLALAEVTITDERDESVDFTEHYLEVDDAILGRFDLEVPDLATARDLAWGAVTGTAQQGVVEESILPRTAVTVYADLDLAIAGLFAGEVEALLLDTPIALAEAERSDGDFSVPAQFATGDRFAGVVPEGSPNRDVLDALIRRARNNGSLEEMRQTWLDPLLGADPSTIPYIPLREEPS